MSSEIRVTFISEKFQKLENIFCTIYGNTFKCCFLYNDGNHVEERLDREIFDELLTGKLLINNSLVNGILLYNNIVENKSATHSFIPNNFPSNFFFENEYEIKTYSKLIVTPLIIGGKIYNCLVPCFSDNKEEIITIIDHKVYSLKSKGKIYSSTHTTTCEIFINKNPIKVNDSLKEFSIFTPENSKLKFRLPDNRIKEILDMIPQEDYYVYEPKLKIVEKKLIDSNEIKSLSENIPKYMEPFVSMFLNKATSSEINLSQFVNFWKEYAYDKMKEIMEHSHRFTKDSISSCVYLSMRIIKEYPYKFNWELVTGNNSITVRDILSNPDYPWDLNILAEYRYIPREFFDYKKCSVPYNYIGSIQENLDKEHTEFYRLLSPDEPPSYQRKQLKLEEISEKEIEAALEMVKEEYSEELDGCYEKFVNKIKQSVTENIKENNRFIFDDFILPTDDDIHEEKEYIPVIPTEDDPYGVREIIENIIINEQEVWSSNYRIRYHNITKIPESCSVYVKNRKEFEEFLATGEKVPFIERCVFFELDDVFRYSSSFSYMSDQLRILYNSGKLTLDYVLSHQNLPWSAERLAVVLPFDYVARNLIFFPDRIKLGFLKDNIFEINSTNDDILDILRSQDEWIIKMLSERKYDEIVDFINQFPKYGKILRQYNYGMRYYEFRIRNNGIETGNFNFMSWDNIKENKYFYDYLFGNDIDYESFSKLSDEQKNIELIECIKIGSNLADLLKNIIPIRLISNIKKIKWTAPDCIDVHDLYQSYSRKIGNSLIFPLEFFDIIPSSDFIKTFILMIRCLIKEKIKRSNQIDTYEWFIEHFEHFMEILIFYNKGMKINNLDSESLFQDFNPEEISKSKYSDPYFMIEKFQ